MEKKRKRFVQNVDMKFTKLNVEIVWDYKIKKHTDQSEEEETLHVLKL